MKTPSLNPKKKQRWDSVPNLLFLALLFSQSLLFMACQNSSEPTPIDYSNPENWSVQCANPEAEVDLFFIHPTTNGMQFDNLIADIDDEALNQFTDVIIENQFVPIFEESCNIFAPRYRQMNIRVLSKSDAEIEQYCTLANIDIETAFKYYLKHLNNGRPYIIAAHSQGSYVFLNLMRKNPKIIDRKKLVSIYLPGWTITTEDLKQIDLKMCSTPAETGCLMIWNTIGKDGESPVLKSGALCTNPLSWNSDTALVERDENLGTHIFVSPDNIVEVSNFTSTKINSRGGLEVEQPIDSIYSQLKMPMGESCYHIYDYDFFMKNIKKNVKLQCKQFSE